MTSCESVFALLSKLKLPAMIGEVDEDPDQQVVMVWLVICIGRHIWFGPRIPVWCSAKLIKSVIME